MIELKFGDRKPKGDASQKDADKYKFTLDELLKIIIPRFKKKKNVGLKKKASIWIWLSAQ